MLKIVRQNVIEILWRDYYNNTPQVKKITQCLLEKGIQQTTLDHIAIIDLPGPNTGIPVLREIFSTIGYEVKGKDYLPEKQNDFVWLAEEDSEGAPATDVLPQVVVADFRLDEMPKEVRKIIEKYSAQAPICPIETMRELAARAADNDFDAVEKLTQLVSNYLTRRDWLVPSIKEFNTVREFNELIAWVLAFGRKPNHFTLSVHLIPTFNSLVEFHEFIEKDVGLALNKDGGIIKGDHSTGIQQGSTIGTPETIQLADGVAELPTGFVEFVWRYTEKEQPKLWEDFFTGFVAKHANRVIQSLYTKD